MDRRCKQSRDFEEQASLKQALANWRRIRSAHWRMLAKARMDGDVVQMASAEAKLYDCDVAMSRLARLVHN